ncbi:MAG: adenylate/guanylate cyclase domain-containing protein [Rhodospirillaceae bacterium]|nr:adenylate/guanylate cyclase domain-containing protein [Rhodospirillaceae bacterium]
MLRDRLPALRRQDARDQLPAALRRDIARAQDESERLISWVQLVIAITFAVLYALSRKTAPSLMLFTPGAIGLYFLFTVTRLVMSYRFRLGFWWLSLSIVIDIALLYGLIWSFHLQYEQPASFYLKAPTLLYIFIFIALRALRFEARYILLAGFTAALGWLAMIAYVVFADPSDNMVTRDYIQYMTSNSILLGAEFDKIISILLVTAIMAIAIRRARATLVRAVNDAQAKRNLSRFFDSDVARRITSHGAELTAGGGEMRAVSILNLDMRGFTRLATRIPPHQVMALLADYQARMVPIIQRHGGVIDKFMGDGIMATFGALETQPDHAACACRALVEAVATADAWRAEAESVEGAPCPPLVCGAVATGEVIVGAVGDDNRLEFTVIGDAVNLSAKLEKHNKELGSRALVTAATYRAAADAGGADAGTALTVSLPGLAAPVEIVRLA